MIMKAKLLTAFIALVFVTCARADEPGKAITPKGGPLKLFNGKNLDGMYTWLKDTKREDPRQVFRVTDGMLRTTELKGSGLCA